MLSASDEAVQVCVDRIRADVEGLEAESLESLGASLGRISNELARLRDQPGADDRVVIHGQECVLEDDGSMQLPAWQPLVLPGLTLAGKGVEDGTDTGAGALVVDESMLDVVRRALREEGMSRERVLRVMPDLFKDQAQDLLLAVAETTPERVVEMAALVVKVSQARGERSQWHPKEGERAVR